MKRYYKTREIAFWAGISLNQVHLRAKKLKLKPKGNSVKKWTLEQAEKLTQKP